MLSKNGLGKKTLPMHDSFSYSTDAIYSTRYSRLVLNYINCSRYHNIFLLISFLHYKLCIYVIMYFTLIGLKLAWTSYSTVYDCCSLADKLKIINSSSLPWFFTRRFMYYTVLQCLVSYCHVNIMFIWVK